MAQRHRLDEVGARFHVTNRGIAKRTIAENGADAESFFEQLTLVVEAGIFAVEAAVLMTTHFHLLLLSLLGESWRGMRRFQNGHSRTFNRSRRRDGPLFRGRYLSRRVDSLAYRHNVIRYIDHNPVTAGMVARPEDHAFGSARHYLHGTDAPWLAKNEVQRMVQGTTGAPRFDPDDYRAVFGYGASSPELIEQRLLRPDTAEDALGRLLPASPSRTLARTLHEDHAPERTRSPSSALRLLCAATAGHSQSRLDPGDLSSFRRGLSSRGMAAASAQLLGLAQSVVTACATLMKSPG